MIEIENIQGYRVREECNSSSHRALYVVDENGNDIANFSITRQSGEDTAILHEKIPCPLLEEDITFYTDALHSCVNCIGIGTQIWMLGELYFYQQADCTYLRLLHDITENGWTERRYPQVLEFLKSQGIPVTCVWEGYFLGKRKAWILLFEKE